MTNPILPLKEFALTVYGGRGPCLETLRQRIRAGTIPGGFIDEGGRYMVDMERYNRARFEAVETESDPMVKQIAEGWG